MARSDNVPLAAAELIREAAAVLFGPTPVPQLAEALEVNTRTVQRWLAGQNTVPAGVWHQLLELVAERERDLARLRVKLETIEELEEE